MPVPTEPKKVSLENLVWQSDHTDVTVFQAALVRTFGFPGEFISGVYDEPTEYAVRDLGSRCVKEGVDLITDDNYPTANLVRMVGLEVRNVR